MIIITAARGSDEASEPPTALRVRINVEMWVASALFPSWDGPALWPPSSVTKFPLFGCRARVAREIAMQP